MLKDPDITITKGVFSEPKKTPYLFLGITSLIFGVERRNFTGIIFIANPISHLLEIIIGSTLFIKIIIFGDLFSK